MRIKFSQRRYRVTKSLVFILALVTALYSSCIQAPAFTGGIRVEATLVTVSPTMGVALFPMPNVPNNGALDHRLGQGGGTETFFNGTTNTFGLSDYPNAVTNAVWSVKVGPSTSPPCLANVFLETVPIGGGDFVFFCHI